MKLAEVAAGNVLTLIASVLYVAATVRGTARPQIISWGAWSLLLAEATFASFVTGQYPSALYTGICAAACGTVTVLSLRRGDWTVTWLDVLSLTAVTAGLVLLAVVRSPAATVIVAAVADLAAYLPTIRHAWDEPREEPWFVYLLFGAGATLTLAAAEITVTGVLYPLYLAVADFFVTVIIVGQRRAERAGTARLLGFSETRSWRYRQTAQWRL